MKSNEQETKPQRNKYSPQFKEQALEHAKQDGVPKAAKDLGLAPAMLYSWQAKARQTGIPFEEQKLQQAEIARLKRENARLAEEVAFLKNRPHVSSRSLCIETGSGLHSWQARTVAARLLEARPRQKTKALREAADPIVAAPCVTPFRKVI